MVEGVDNVYITNTLVTLILKHVDNGDFFCLTFIQNWEFILSIRSSVLLFDRGNFQVFLLNPSKSSGLNGAFSTSGS